MLIDVYEDLDIIHKTNDMWEYANLLLDNASKVLFFFPSRRNNVFLPLKTRRLKVKASNKCHVM